MEVSPELAEELLQAADQYMLESLKRLCEIAIADTLTVENLASVYELAENFDAPQLAKRCVLFALAHYSGSSGVKAPPGFSTLLRRMGPKVCLYPTLLMTSCGNLYHNIPVVMLLPLYPRIRSSSENLYWA